MGEEVALRTLDTARRAGVGGFVYSIGADGIGIGYLREEDLQFEQYNIIRARESALEPRQVSQVEQWVSQNPVSYIAVTGDQGTVLELEGTLLDDDAPQVTGYENIYTQTRCLELADHRTGKEAPARTLVSELCVDELVVLGDNHNDLELMRLADIGFAPPTPLLRRSLKPPRSSEGAMKTRLPSSSQSASCDRVAFDLDGVVTRV